MTADWEQGIKDGRMDVLDLFRGHGRLVYHLLGLAA